MIVPMIDPETSIRARTDENDIEMKTIENTRIVRHTITL